MSMRNATLKFVAELLWLLVGTTVAPTQADNVLTRYRVVMVVALGEGLEIDFAR